MSTQEFNELVVKASVSLKPYALHLTKDREDAKDLIQETICKAISASSRFTEGSNINGWIYTIMKNLYINEYRRRTKWNKLVEFTPSYAMPTGTEVPVDNRGETKLLTEDINQSIDKMKDSYRVPFLMFYNGYKYHEIAKHLQLNMNTVKSRIHLARKELKYKLAHQRN